MVTALDQKMSDTPGLKPIVKIPNINSYQKIIFVSEGLEKTLFDALPMLL